LIFKHFCTTDDDSVNPGFLVGDTHCPTIFFTGMFVLSVDGLVLFRIDVAQLHDNVSDLEASHDGEMGDPNTTKYLVK